jgi:cysteine-rich repeat protein
VPDALFHLARCGDTAPTQWNCTQFDSENPVCGTETVTAINSDQILASLQGRVVVAVDDDACPGPDPQNQTRISLRVKPSGGADFSISDRLLNLCAGMPQCGACDPAANCCDPLCSFDQCDPFNTHCCLPGSSCSVDPGSCPLDPVLLCEHGGTFWNEDVLQGNNPQGGATFDAWLTSHQLVLPSMTADILSNLPPLPGQNHVSVIVRGIEIPSGFVDGIANGGPSKREFCLDIKVITLPDPARTTVLDPGGVADTASLTGMGTCGCGDGLIVQGEECDDANTASGDGCDASCQREACWTCSGQPSFCSLAAARMNCRQPTEPAKSLLKMSNKTNDMGDLLKWKWSKGQATMDFGNPVDTDAYDLCIYHDAGSRPLLGGVRARVGGTCDGKPCWSAKGNGGFKYKNKTGVPSGLVKLTLKPGEDTKAKIVAKGKGEELTLPVLPLPLPALVQLQRSGHTDCWEAVFSTAAMNVAEKFDARSD